MADLLARFLPRLRRWASGRLPGPVRDLADTSDLVQDVLLQLFQKIKGLEIERQGGLQAYCGRRSSTGFGTSSERRSAGPRALDRYEAALAELRRPQTSPA